MPIRTKPWSEVTLQDVEDLIAREIREDSTIEFKRQINLTGSEARAEFLKDVSAMANAVGGTIIYGAVEGEGNQRGQIVDIKGQALDRDQLELQITNILRDGLDERLDGVLFAALPTGATGEYVFVLRVPASPLAPHRISTGKSQFYRRGSVSNDFMNTRQIREMILQRETAVDRARLLVEGRTGALKLAGANRRNTLQFNPAPNTAPNQVALHVIPLFPQAGGWRLGPESERRLMAVPPLGAPEPSERPFYAADGMHSRFRDRRHVFFMRGGGIEFQRYDVLVPPDGRGGKPMLSAWHLEADILKALAQCEALTADGLLPLPVMVSVRLLDVPGTLLLRHPGDYMGSEHPQEYPDVFLTPVVLHSWGQNASEQMRQVFDEMWQAWHVAASMNYHDDGSHHEYDEQGRFVRPVGHSAEGA